MENTHDFELPREDELDSLTEIFSLFADSSRIRIICALLDHELTVGEICDRVEMSQSAVSHQLRILRQARVVNNRRSGRSNYYTLDDSHVEEILRMGLHHVREDDEEDESRA